MGCLSLNVSLMFVAFVPLFLALSRALAVDFPEGFQYRLFLCPSLCICRHLPVRLYTVLTCFCMLSLCFPDIDRLMSSLCISPAFDTRLFPLALWSFSFICAITVSWSQPYSLLYNHVISLYFMCAGYGLPSVTRPCTIIVSRLRPILCFVACAAVT